MDKKRIGAFIKDVRREKGLTQEQFAEKLGVSQKSVSRWETGKTMPDYSLLASICDVLEINAAELLGAERIDGDIITKQQATDMTRTLISLVSGRHGVRKIVGAVLSAVIMLVCAVGLYNYEFSVSVDSTTDLEKAVNEYHSMTRSRQISWKCRLSATGCMFSTEKRVPRSVRLSLP